VAGDAHNGLRKGTVTVRSTVTLREAATALCDGIEDGSIRHRSGDHYKPSVVRGYCYSRERHVLPEIGHLRLGDVRRNDVQDLADGLLRSHNPSTVRNVLMPLRVIYRRAVHRGEVAVNPTTELELPGPRAPRAHCHARRGDATTRRAQRRRPAAVGGRAIRRAALWGTPSSALGGREPERRRDPRGALVGPHGRPRGTKVRRRTAQGADRRGATRRAARAADAPGPPRRPRVRPHRRSTVPVHNLKALTSIMGHSRVTVMMDRNGHLLPGSDAEVVGLLDRYLAADAGAGAALDGAKPAQTPEIAAPQGG
jgi:integrase